MNNIIDAKLTAKRLINESVLVTKEKIKQLTTKAEFKTEQDKIVALQIYDLGLFISQSYFAIDGAQLYLILPSLYYALKE